MSSNNDLLFVFPEPTSVSPVKKEDVILSPLKLSPELETQVRRFHTSQAESM